MVEDNSDNYGKATKSTVSVVSEEPAELSKISPFRFWLMVTSICLGLLLANMNTSIVATCLYTIAIDFDDLSNVNWVALSYTLSYMSFAVPISKVSDIVGRRNTFISSHIIFLVFSLAGGWSQSLNQLIAIRAVQGIGGSGLVTLSLIILPEISPRKLRGVVGSLVGVVMTVAGVLGPVVGGLLTSHVGWRWTFWINGPLGIISLLLFLLSWRTPQNLSLVATMSWKDLDYVGSFLIIAASSLTVFAFQNVGASSTAHWDTAIFIAPLVTGVLCWFALFAWQYFIQHLKPGYPSMLPLCIFKDIKYAFGAFNILLTGFPFLCLLYMVPLRAQVIGDMSASNAGMMLLPMLITVSLGTIIGSYLHRCKQRCMELLVLGSALLTVGCGLLTTLSDELNSAKMAGFLTVCGLGIGVTMSTVTLSTSADIALEHHAPAQGLLSQLRLFGGSLGIAASTVFLHANMGEPLSSLGTIHHGANNSELQSLKSACSQAFRNDMVISTAIAGVATLLTIIGLGRITWKGERCSS